MSNDISLLWDKAIRAMNDPNIPDDVPIRVCDYDQKFISFLQTQKIPKFVVINGGVYTTANESPIHYFAQNFIRAAIAKSINKQIPEKEYISLVGRVLVCNTHTCHSIQHKHFDFGIFDYDFSQNDPLNSLPFLVSEVSYTHENLHLLLCVCAHYLTEFTTGTMYSMGIFISPPSYRFFLLFFLFERETPPDPKSNQRIHELYQSGCLKLDMPAKRGHTKCYGRQNIPLTDEALGKVFAEENIRKEFGVRLVHFSVLYEDDIDAGASLNFQMTGQHFGREKNINIDVPSIVLQDILLIWRNERENR